MSLLDFIFPKRCVVCRTFGDYLCVVDRSNIQPAKSFCPVCLKAAIGGTTHGKCKRKHTLDGLICIFEYKSPVKEIIAELKYRFVKDLAQIIKVELKKTKFLDKYDFSGFIITPIPLSSKRKNWRGFNQTEILGEIIAHRLKLRFLPNLLQKVKETKPQVKLTKKERMKQVKGTFGLTKKCEIRGKKFIIFDDVWTTGATAKAAATLLKRKGAERVWAITLASSH